MCRFPCVCLAYLGIETLGGLCVLRLFELSLPVHDIEVHVCHFLILRLTRGAYVPRLAVYRDEYIPPPAYKLRLGQQPLNRLLVHREFGFLFFFCHSGVLKGAAALRLPPLVKKIIMDQSPDSVTGSHGFSMRGINIIVSRFAVLQLSAVAWMVY